MSSKSLAAVLLGCSLTAFGISVEAERPKPVSLITLLANPETFDEKRVMVRGYLRIVHEPDHPVRVNLYLHQEDARNLLSNEILVIPNEQMLRDEEKIDRMYVIATGMFHAVHAVGDDSPSSGVLKDIQTCVPWSDPNHPVGLRVTRD